MAAGLPLAGSADRSDPGDPASQLTPIRLQRAIPNGACSAVYPPASIGLPRRQDQAAGGLPRAIGEYLRQKRHEAGLTQAEVAAALGVGQPAVAKLEARSDILLSTLQAYLKAVGGRYTIEASVG